MNKKGEVEVTPAGILLAVIGAVLGYFVAKSMHPGIFWVLLSTIACGGAGIIIASIASNN